MQATRCWRRRPRRSWPEPTPGSVGLSCDGCRGSGDLAVGLGGWGVSGSRGRRRGGGGGARARRGLPHVRGDGGPGGEAEAAPLRGGAPPKEQSEAPVQVRALPPWRPLLAGPRGRSSSVRRGPGAQSRTFPSSAFLAQKGNFCCTERGEVFRLGHLWRKYTSFVMAGRPRKDSLPIV